VQLIIDIDLLSYDVNQELILVCLVQLTILHPSLFFLKTILGNKISTRVFVHNFVNSPAFEVLDVLEESLRFGYKIIDLLDSVGCDVEASLLHVDVIQQKVFILDLIILFLLFLLFVI
jgi:hypothetical protein